MEESELIAAVTHALVHAWVIYQPDPSGTIGLNMPNEMSEGAQVLFRLVQEVTDNIPLLRIQPSGMILTPMIKQQGKYH